MITTTFRLSQIFFETILHCIFPPACLGCSAPLLWHHSPFLCPQCYAKIHWIDETACRFCGAPTGPYAVLGKGCSACRQHRMRFTRAIATAPYASPAREIIHALKFYDRRALARPMGELMAARVITTDFPRKLDAIIPVPLHSQRQRSRGYNQSHLLAKVIGDKLGVPFTATTLTRTRNTPPQSLLRQHYRLQNLTGAFRVDKVIPGKTVLLVDDVMTTGTTVSECAEVLRKAGAERVYVVVFAR